MMVDFPRLELTDPDVSILDLGTIQEALPALRKIKEFPLFPNLLQELRLMIWEQACNEPRLVELETKHRKLKIEKDGKEAYTIFPLRFISSTPEPSLLFVCRESRKIALKSYKRTDLADELDPNPLFFEYGIDIMYLGNKAITLWMKQNVRDYELYEPKPFGWWTVNGVPPTIPVYNPYISGQINNPLMQRNSVRPMERPTFPPQSPAGARFRSIQKIAIDASALCDFRYHCCLKHHRETRHIRGGFQFRHIAGKNTGQFMAADEGLVEHFAALTHLEKIYLVLPSMEDEVHCLRPTRVFRDAEIEPTSCIAMMHAELLSEMRKAYKNRALPAIEIVYGPPSGASKTNNAGESGISIGVEAFDTWMEYRDDFEDRNGPTTLPRIIEERQKMPAFIAKWMQELREPLEKRICSQLLCDKLHMDGRGNQEKMGPQVHDEMLAGRVHFEAPLRYNLADNERRMTRAISGPWEGFH